MHLLHLSVLSVASGLSKGPLEACQPRFRIGDSSISSVSFPSRCYRIISSHHPLVAQPSCLLSSHCAGCLLRCLSLHRLSSTLVVTATFASALPCLVFAVERRQMLLPALNLPFTAIIEHHLYCPLLPQLPSIATVKCQCPPSSIAVVKH